MTNANAADVLIAGGGISGLALAGFLAARGRSVLVLEAGPDVGGTMQTVGDGPWRADRGPSSFLGPSTALDELLRWAGAAERIETPGPVARRRYIARGDKLHRVGPGLLFGGLLTLRGRLGLLGDLALTRARVPAGEATVADFFRRHFGAESADYLAGPLVSGIQAGDPDRLSLDAAFPRLRALERARGSVVRAALSGAAGQAARRSVQSFQGGMGTLPLTLAERLGPAVRTHAPVRALRHVEGRYEVETDGERLRCAVLALAAPAPAAAPLLRALDGELADLLASIPYAPVAVVHTGVRASALTPRGLGVLLPRREGFGHLGTLFPSACYARRAPEGHALFTSFVGGRLDPEALPLSDDQLHARVRTDLVRLRLMDEREPMVWGRVIRHPQAIPQYELGHQGRVAAIQQRLTHHPGLHLTGNYLTGIAVGDCLTRARELAERLAPA